MTPDQYRTHQINLAVDRALTTAMAFGHAEYNAGAEYHDEANRNERRVTAQERYDRLAATINELRDLALTNTALQERLVEQAHELSQVHEDNARLTGRVAWFYRNSTRMTQMRYDAATAAGYDFTQYAATMEQPADRDALLAYLREEITLAEREIVLIEGTVEQKAALHIGDGWNCVVCGESYPCPTATAGFEADLADLPNPPPADIA